MAANLNVFLQVALCRRLKRDQPLLLPLAENLNRAVLPVYIRKFDCNQFGHATHGIKQKKHGEIVTVSGKLRAIRCIQQPLKLLFGERLDYAFLRLN
ncbi:hypothetical protein D3C75_1160630 [compost metagenome]